LDIFSYSAVYDIIINSKIHLSSVTVYVIALSNASFAVQSIEVL